jgi:hypothetical protein
MEILLVYSVEAYVRKWTKREKEEVDALLKWVKAVRLLIQIRIRKFKWSMSTNSTSVFKYPDVVKHLLVKTHVDVVVPANKTPYNIPFIYKKPYMYYVWTELVLDSSQDNPTDTATTLSKEEIIDNHKPVSFSSNETINRQTTDN